MSRKRTKQYLMLLMVIGLVSIAAGGGGTFASFTAETANGGNTFATGTLYLHDTVQGGGSGTCTSESSSTNSNVDPNSNGVYPGDNCDALFQLTAGSAPVSVGLTLANAGSLDASGLSLASNDPGCVESTVYESNAVLSQAVSNAGAVTTIHLSAPGLTLALRDGETIQLYHNATTSDTFTVNGAGVDATNGVFPVGSTTIDVTSHQPTHSYIIGDAFKSTPGFSGAGGSLCTKLDMTITESAQSDFSDVTVDPVTGDTSGGLGCAYGSANIGGDGCTMGGSETIGGIPLYSANAPDALTLASNPVDTNTDTGLDAGTARYFMVVVKPDVDNGDQSKLAKFDLVWHMDQA